MLVRLALSVPGTPRKHGASAISALAASRSPAKRRLAGRSLGTLVAFRPGIALNHSLELPRFRVLGTTTAESGAEGACMTMTPSENAPLVDES